MCDEHGILLIFDEVQSGFGRTGQMFAAQTFDVRPDVMAVAKGIANGFPLGATVSSRELMGRWSAGSHGTTFGGNPVACAAASCGAGGFRRRKCSGKCAQNGRCFHQWAERNSEKHDFIGDVRGKGLMIALEIIKSDKDENA